MGPLFALLIIVMLSLLVVRVGTNALVLTGMSLEAAKFQSASAFFGVGFTTSEAEMVMRHAVRRGVILKLIIAGNIGLTSALATLIVSFANDSAEVSHMTRLGLTIAGVVIVAFLLNLKIVKKPVDAVMTRFLQSSGVVKAVDYETLLKVENGYSVSEITIHADHPWCGKMLMESRPSKCGIVVLNVLRKDGEFTGAPDKDFMLLEGDEVMIYGADSCVLAAANHMKNS